MMLIAIHLLSVSWIDDIWHYGSINIAWHCFYLNVFHMFFICFRSAIFICNCIQAIMHVQRNENYRDKRFEYETNVVYSRMNMILWYDINIMNSSVKANFLIYHYLIQEQKEQSLQITCSEYLRCFVSLLTFTCEFYCILTQLRI